MKYDLRMRNVLYTLASFSFALLARAAQECDPSKELCDPLRDIGGISGFVQTLLEDIVLPIGIPVVAIAIIYTGFLFVTAQGSDEKLNRAKKALLWTLVGAVVFLGAWVFASAIEGTIGQLRGD